ncbi:hypothetical protein PAPYR_6740 [Paratrimastix pyriformis]|uniref:Uncharacterized protein n=1 Tax=Paratrimastix pyriformis TaxID=342808 RepID=A0ABQ8UEN0_9EUKA|nr:hypothetical protein PAPYR_6740 [Paratrimastix pyriformis]
MGCCFGKEEEIITLPKPPTVTVDSVAAIRSTPGPGPSSQEERAPLLQLTKPPEAAPISIDSRAAEVETEGLYRDLLSRTAQDFISVSVLRESGLDQSRTSQTKTSSKKKPDSPLKTVQVREIPWFAPPSSSLYFPGMRGQSPAPMVISLRSRAMCCAMGCGAQAETAHFRRFIIEAVFRTYRQAPLGLLVGAHFCGFPEEPAPATRKLFEKVIPPSPSHFWEPPHSSPPAAPDR